MGNRSSIRRDGSQTAEAYRNDLAQQATVGVDNSNAHTYGYDANGNRTNMNGTGTYVTNFLNQPTTFDGQTVSYNINGDAITYGSNTTYAYDAQNRMTNVSAGAYASTFVYDGLNRKISQTVNGVTTYNVWDGWNLIEERGSGNALINSYVYGAGEIVERITGAATHFYYQDGLGSTSHLADAAGVLQESYKYGTFGQTSVFAPGGGIRRDGSIHDVRHLYTGQLWMPAAGLYDYRYRVFSPALTRFLQPDPIGFAGDPSNLYRFCENNAVNWNDPMGLVAPQKNNKPVTKKPIHHKNNQYYSSGSGLDDTHSYGWDGQTFGPGGLADRTFIEPWGPNVGPWGERPGGALDFGPNDHGSPGGAPGGRGRLGGGNGTRPGSSRGTGHNWFDIPTRNIEGFDIDAGRLARIGSGFDSPGLQQMAFVFERGATYYVVGWGAVAMAPGLWTAGSAAAPYAVTGWNGLVGGVEYITLTGVGAGIVAGQQIMANPHWVVWGQHIMTEAFASPGLPTSGTGMAIDVMKQATGFAGP